MGTPKPTSTSKAQQSMADFVLAMGKAGLLTRIKEEKRVDELPLLTEAYPEQAIFVEKIKDSEFSFLANAYATHAQFAWALGCTDGEIGARISKLAQGRIKPEVVSTAPCKEVILKGADVDITRLPLFLHHDRDGHAYTSDNLVVTKDPDSGIPDWGIYRSMFRGKNEKNFDMTCTSHRARHHALKYQARGQDMPAALILGGPTLDKLRPQSEAAEPRHKSMRAVSHRSDAARGVPALPAVMKAVPLLETGRPDVRRVVDMPVPRPGRSQALVRVRAAGVNRHDINQRRCGNPHGAHSNVLGLEIAGRVVMRGAGSRLYPGTRVAALVDGGAPILPHHIVQAFATTASRSLP